MAEVRGEGGTAEAVKREEEAVSLTVSLWEKKTEAVSIFTKSFGLGLGTTSGTDTDRISLRVTSDET